MAITSTSSPQPDRSVSAKKNKIKSPNSKVDYENKSHKKLSKKDLSSPAKRNNNPGIRLIHGRIYDSHNGKTCHQVIFLHKSQKTYLSVDEIFMIR